MKGHCVMRVRIPEAEHLAALAGGNFRSQTQEKLFQISMCLLCCWGSLSSTCPLLPHSLSPVPKLKFKFSEFGSQFLTPAL